MQGDDLIACVLRAHAVLERESDLSPANPRINAALSALVQFVMQGCGSPAEAARALAAPSIAAIRTALVRRLALAEGALERHWAGVFSQRDGLTAANFPEFPYWDCYRSLVEAELACLRPYLTLGTAESLAFVGAGPLPLSAVLLHAATKLRVTCVDADSGACSLAQTLLRRAGLTGIEVRCAAGADHEYAPHPVVMVASLVQDKVQVMRRIRATRPAAVVGLRSAEGLCTLLYEAVDEAQIEALGCGYLGRTAPNPHAINTTLLYEASPRRWGLREHDAVGEMHNLANSTMPPGARPQPATR
jgi:hypothetical protein